MILKACNRNITGKATPVYSGTVNLEVTVDLNFWSSGLIISLERIKFYISLLGLSLWTLDSI